tara:strand:- start:418 stop:885 length:468 start_codon:yes stop_codon:yes gene_type:complete
MKILHNTILICLLLTPITVYAIRAKSAPVKILIEEVHEEIQETELDKEVEEPVPTEKELIKREIQEVFGDEWKLAYAVMMSESSGRVKITNQNKDDHRSIDRGLFQINSYWHPDVSIDCAFDMKCNIKEAYRISKGGKNWNPWYGYLHGGYKKFL